MPLVALGAVRGNRAVVPADALVEIFVNPFDQVMGALEQSGIPDRVVDDIALQDAGPGPSWKTGHLHVSEAVIGEARPSSPSPPHSPAG